MRQCIRNIIIIRVTINIITITRNIISCDGLQTVTTEHKWHDDQLAVITGSSRTIGGARTNTTMVGAIKKNFIKATTTITNWGHWNCILSTSGRRNHNNSVHLQSTVTVLKRRTGTSSIPGGIWDRGKGSAKVKTIDVECGDGVRHVRVCHVLWAMWKCSLSCHSMVHITYRAYSYSDMYFSHIHTCTYVACSREFTVQQLNCNLHFLSFQSFFFITAFT